MTVLFLFMPLSSISEINWFRRSSNNISLCFSNKSHLHNILYIWSPLYPFCSSVLCFFLTFKFFFFLSNEISWKLWRITEFKKEYSSWCGWMWWDPESHSPPHLYALEDPWEISRTSTNMMLKQLLCSITSTAHGCCLSVFLNLGSSNWNLNWKLWSAIL